MNSTKSSNFKQSRTLLLILIFTLVLTSCAKNSTESSFKFVFLTDVHVQPELDANKGFKMAIDKINALDSDFVITGGDLVMDALDESFDRSVEQFDLYEKISNVINAPVYNAIGNHDMFGVYDDSGINKSHPEYGKMMYKNRISDGETYYSFDHKNWHFMILDVISITNDNRYMGYVDSVQIDWIKNDLKTIDKTTPIVVAAHIPFITAAKQLLYGYPAEMSPSLVVKNELEVLKLFEEYNLRIVLQGHLHIVEEIIFKDIHFVTGGAVSGKWWQGDNHGFEEGFIVVNIDNENFNWEYIDSGWESTFVDTSTKE